MKPQEKPTGVYFHIPFCPTLCDFCAFYKNLPDREQIRRYLATMQREWNLRPPEQTPTTVFWGGGTPTLLHPDQLTTLASPLRQLPTPREWTVEAAPATLNQSKLRTLRELGVTRISIGIQSLHPELLDRLGRHHSRTQAIRSYEMARAEGFASVNLDFMFALPGQTEEQLRADLGEAIALAPDHLSTYCLTFEEDTALYVRLSEGKVSRDPAQEARLYRTGWEVLEEAGYRQYEISNFARPGHQCIHNLNTWRMEEWSGYGPGAASQTGGWRFTNIPDAERWREGVESGRLHFVDREEVNARLLATDRILFGIRLADGIPLASFADPEFSPGEVAGLTQLCERLVDEDFAIAPDDTFRLTLEGKLRCDAIARAVLECIG